jgi:hypothetical protein
LLTTATTVAAILLAFGGIQELWVRGVLGGETQPFVIGAIGAGLAVILVPASMALKLQWSGAEHFAIVTALALAAFHAYAALPPHRNVGFPALLVALAVSALLIVCAVRPSPDRAG